MLKTPYTLLALTLACFSATCAQMTRSYEGKGSPEHWGELSEQW